MTNLDAALLPILDSIQAQINVFTQVYGRLRIEMVKGVDNLVSIDKDKPRKLPVYWDQTKKRSIPILPDQKKGGLLFFVTTGAVKVVNPEPGWVIQTQTQTKQYPLALLAWWDSSKQAFSREQVQLAIETALGSCFDWQTESIEDQLATRVFRDLDYDFTNHGYLMNPFVGLRIEGTLTVVESLCNS
ncbi:hypothetical protein [Spirosoma aerolatum]|uniref:hypothetical protein n=1 Tax=Spirosoma aerolatum TaxID=1211326 RepID=UPI0009AD2F1C|nr:hypothetical protein [Spirosoma aerolatum]